MTGFAGTYLASDVEFLLQQLTLPTVDILEKERLIQSGQKHYSQMLSEEPKPTALHQQFYQQALQQGGVRFAQDIELLASALAPYAHQQEITLVSFVRAGLPIAILLKRALIRRGCRVTHYGVSIIRDKGIDHVAMAHILAHHHPDSIFFVDGWTGKGAIAQELAQSLSHYPELKHRLITLADPCGKAWLAASAEDWLIPSGVLGASISGLVSRSVLTEQGFHGCMLCPHLADVDVSQSFIEHIDHLAQQTILGEKTIAPWTHQQAQHLQQASQTVIHQFAQRHQVHNINRIKVGIAEATRAVMRRVPEKVLVRSDKDPDIALLLYLAKQTGVRIEEAGEALGQYRALTLIRSMR
ncbi:cysteine protease StiP domain-containing protein [Agitococcus lubricus]|uniref:RNA binding Pelota-like protein n=1 Tax=Agitococcus lubricus TaxID=1077255 RepID=A0A2T5J2K0_9GAMM|nr:cysteine protease StiP domain-containing protein [Agitococcus lubricus]PTQ90749.1 RNA binding Pelota-like protein [Agitococcus lubricus]